MPSESPYFWNFFAVEQVGTVPSHSFSHLLPPSSSHHPAILLNPLLHDWMVPVEVPAMYYDCFSLVFLAMALSNPFTVSLQYSNSFAGDFIHLNNGRLPIGVCF